MSLIFSPYTFPLFIDCCFLFFLFFPYFWLLFFFYFLYTAHTISVCLPFFLFMYFSFFHSFHFDFVCTSICLNFLWFFCIWIYQSFYFSIFYWIQFICCKPFEILSLLYTLLSQYFLNTYSVFIYFSSISFNLPVLLFNSFLSYFLLKTKQNFFLPRTARQSTASHYVIILSTSNAMEIYSCSAALLNNHTITTTTASIYFTFQSVISPSS